jgi:hypothetical protein
MAIRPQARTLPQYQINFGLNVRTMFGKLS